MLCQHRTKFDCYTFTFSFQDNNITVYKYEIIPKHAWPKPPLYQTCKPYSFVRTVGLKGNSPTLYMKSFFFLGGGKYFHRAWKIKFLYVSTNIQDRTFLWRTETFIAILSVEENQCGLKVVMSNGHLKRYYFEICQVTSCVITTLIFHSGVALWVVLTPLGDILRNMTNKH